MSAKIYLLGTVHPLSIEKTIKDTEEFSKLLANIELVVMEAPLSKPTLKTKLKAPELYIGLFIYYVITKIAKTISHIISNKGKGDKDSFMLFISEKVKRNFQKMEIQDLKTRDNAVNQPIKIVSCYDSDLNKDISGKGLGYTLFNYIAFIFSFLFFLSGVGSIIVNKSNYISYMFIFISIGIPIYFFSNYVEKGGKLEERNDISVDYCKQVIANKYEKVLVFYGYDHIEDINQKLKACGIETEIIPVKIPKLLKCASKLNRKYANIN